MHQLLDACLTWKHATYALAALLMGSGSGVVWLDNELDALQADVASVESIKEDVKIIKECLIKKECG